jgi:hypothetical protein
VTVAVYCLALQVQGAAVSTVDYTALVVLMCDMRIKLLEDAVEQQRVRDMGRCLSTPLLCCCHFITCMPMSAT